MRFKAFNIEFEISYLFFALVCIALFANNYDFLYVILFSSLHETGHIVSLYLLGGRADKIKLSFYGIGLKHSSSLTQIQETIFLLSGVFVNVLFVVLNVKREINLALALINILPLYPLDMGRCVKLLLESAFSLSLSDTLLKIISTVFLIILVAYSIYSKTYSLLIISAYLMFWLIRGNI